jgi:RHS repeat-associated protein
VGGCHALDPESGVLLRGDGGVEPVRVLDPAAAQEACRWGRLADDEVAVLDDRELVVFDAAGRHRRSVDAVTGSVRLRAEHDEHGRLSAWTGRGTARSVVERSADRWAIHTADGLRADLGFDPRGRLVWVGVGGAAVSIEHDERDLITATTDALGLRTEVAHDDDGRAVTVARSTGEREDLVRTDEPGGHRVVTTTAAGRERSVARRRLPAGGHRLERRCCGLDTPRIDVRSGADHHVRHPDGTTSIRTVAADGRSRTQLTTTTTPAGRSLLSAREVAEVDGVVEERLIVAGRPWTRRYHPSTRTIEERSPAGRVGTIRRDPTTRTLRVRRPGEPLVEITADDAGRPVRVRRGDQVIELSRDDAGRVVTISDGSRTRAVEHDALGRVVAQELDGGRLRVGHDLAGNVVSLAPPGRPATELRRAADGALVEVRHPAVDGHAAVERLEYDADRRLVARSVSGGPTVRATLDAAGRVIRLGDGAADDTTFEWDGAGRLIDAASAHQALRREHDGRHLVAEDAAGDVAGRIERHLDDDRWLRRLVVDGVAIDHEHDDDGLVTRAGPVRVTRDPTTGRPTAISVGALVTHLRHDVHGRLERSVTVHGDTVLLDEVVTRHADGRLASVVERSGDRVRRIEVGRDGADRLAEVLVDGEPRLRVQRGPNGDPERIERHGVVELGESDDADRLRRLGDRSYRYGPAGEVEQIESPAGVSRLVHDAHGRLTRVELADGRVVEHRYDPLGRRIRTFVDGRPISGLRWLGDRPLAHVDAAGTVTQRFVHLPDGGAPIAAVTDDRVLRLITDVTGSVRLVVDAGTGAVLQRCDYDPLGRRVADDAPGLQPFGFAGGIHDPATGLVHLGARVLDPVSGRFTTRDPLRFAGGQTNPYLHADGNPVDWHDPTGTTVEVCSRPFIGSGPMSIDHAYLKTDAHAKGMDRDPNGMLLETRFKDEPQLDHPETECDEIENVDEECVNRHLEANNALGSWGADFEGGKLDPNTCWDVVWDTLDACSDGDWEVKDDGDDEEAHGPVADTFRALDKFRKWQGEVWDSLTGWL